MREEETRGKKYRNEKSEKGEKKRENKGEERRRRGSKEERRELRGEENKGGEETKKSAATNHITYWPFFKCIGGTTRGGLGSVTVAVHMLREFVVLYCSHIQQYLKKK